MELQRDTILTKNNKYQIKNISIIKNIIKSQYRTTNNVKSRN